MLESLEKEELINIIQKLEKENKELKEKIYGKIEEKDKIQISEILNDMCQNVFRNSMILEDIKKNVLEGRIPIVLTERIEHKRSPRRFECASCNI